jgi:hypothetical protein
MLQCVDSLVETVFSSYLLVKSRRERSAASGRKQAGAEGATAPETLRQTDRATGYIWKETLRADGLGGVRRRDNTLRHSDRWGFYRFSGNFPC